MKRPVFRISDLRGSGHSGRIALLAGVFVSVWGCSSSSPGSRPTTDAGPLDVAVDMSPEVRPVGVTCPADDPTNKRPLGGCCSTGDACATGLCLGGLCSKTCATPSDCAGAAATPTPLPPGTTFKCAATSLVPAASVCLPGSLAACGAGGTPCGAGESCSLVIAAAATSGGPSAWAGACTTKLVAGAYAQAGSACDDRGSPYQCETGGGVLGSGCWAGHCTIACTVTADCPLGMFCDVPPFFAGVGGTDTGPGIEGTTGGTTGLCLGYVCGHLLGKVPPGTVEQLASDAVCPPGEVCGLGEAVGATGDGWLLTCRRPLASAQAVGAACSTDAAAGQRCVSDLSCGNSSEGATCGTLCRNDADCPADTLCVADVTAPTLPSGATPALAMCRPKSKFGGQACVREGDCPAGQACKVVSPRSSFRVCRAATGAAAVGTSCKADADCRSGECVDRALLGPNGSNQTFCTSFCLKNGDCGANQICEQVVRSNNGTPQDPTDDVVFGQCIPLTAQSNKGGCKVDADCLAQLQDDERGGDTCDLSLHTCFKKVAAVGDPCRYRAECPLGATCIFNDARFRNGMCVTYGCSPTPTAAVDQCPTGTVCATRAVDAPVMACFPGCTKNSDCARSAEGYICDTLQGTTAKVCEIGIGG